MGLAEGFETSRLTEGWHWARLLLLAALLGAGGFAAKAVVDHAVGIDRACANQYAYHQARAQHLLEHHCSVQGYAQSDDCVAARKVLMEDRAHAVQVCVGQDLRSHLSGWLDPWMAAHFVRELSDMSFRLGFVLVVALVLVVYVFGRASAAAVKVSQTRRAAVKARLPTEQPGIPLADPATWSKPVFRGPAAGGAPRNYYTAEALGSP